MIKILIDKNKVKQFSQRISDELKSKQEFTNILKDLNISCDDLSGNWEIKNKGDVKLNFERMKEIWHSFELNSRSSCKVVDYQKILVNEYKKLRHRKVVSEFFEYLDVHVCPYCNMHQILTFKYTDRKNLDVKSEISCDHFFNKSECPLLSINIWNFVPICGICNSLKSTNEFDFGNYLYDFQTITDQKIFSIDLSRMNIFNKYNINNFKVTIDSSKTQSKILKLVQKYNHKIIIDQLLEVVKLDDFINEPAYLKFAEDFAKSIGEFDFSTMQLNKVLDKENFKKLGLSKAKYDLIQYRDI